MAYITYEQYIALYGDPGLTEQDFLVYANSASDLIDIITRYCIEEAGGINALPPFVQTLVQKAAAAQVLYFTQYGFDTVLTGQTGESFTVGKVSVQGASMASAGGNTAAQKLISPMAQALLEQSGLMGRNVPCFGPSRNGCWGMW